MKEFIDKTSEQNGTIINREALMAIQGFDSKVTRFLNDGSIVETNNEGHTKTTVFNANGSITETFVGQKSISKTTVFESNGTIREVLS